MIPSGSAWRTSSCSASGLPLLLLTAVLALALSGCSKQLNTDEIAKRIRDLAIQQGATVRSVKCPSDVKAKKGGTFTCAITYASGERQRVLVRQRDDNGRVTMTTGGGAQ